MQLEDLKAEYDKLQIRYGARELTSIYNGGCTNKPDICFVFMNPTGRNIASDPNWKGRRSPWIGTKNIWKLFYRIGLLDEKIYENIMAKKPQEWDEKFADLVYKNVEKHKYFITNLGKCTQVDARVLPNSVYSKYLDLLCKEIEIINPKIIITLGNQVSSIVLNRNISVSQCRKERRSWQQLRIRNARTRRVWFSAKGNPSAKMASTISVGLPRMASDILFMPRP